MGGRNLVNNRYYILEAIKYETIIYIDREF